MAPRPVAVRNVLALPCRLMRAEKTGGRANRPREPGERTVARSKLGLTKLDAVRTRLPVGTAHAFPLERHAVVSCIDGAARPGDALFERAASNGLGTLEPSERRGALPGTIGHIAESVVEVVLVGLGWTPIWHFVGPGRHGVDLMLLSPGADRVVAVEVKGTLRPGTWPHLRRAEAIQMAVHWLDKPDNPAMAEWGVTAADLYGGIVLVNFHSLQYKAFLSNDFATWSPVTRLDELEDLDWIDR